MNQPCIRKFLIHGALCALRYSLALVSPRALWPLGGRAIGVLTPTAHRFIYDISNIFYRRRPRRANVGRAACVQAPRRGGNRRRRAPRRAARTRTRRVPRPRVARASPSDPAPSGWSAHSTAQLQLLRNTTRGLYLRVRSHQHRATCSCNRILLGATHELNLASHSG